MDKNCIEEATLELQIEVNGDEQLLKCSVSSLKLRFPPPKGRSGSICQF